MAIKIPSLRPPQGTTQTDLNAGHEPRLISSDVKENLLDALNCLISTDSLKNSEKFASAALGVILQ